LIAAICQVIDQRYTLQRSLDRLKADADLSRAYGYAIQCVVIAGSNYATTREQRAFDLARHSHRDVVVVTFDELLGKLKGLQKLFAPATDEEIHRSRRRDDAGG
jgi:hypothetical protein